MRDMNKSKKDKVSHSEAPLSEEDSVMEQEATLKNFQGSDDVVSAVETADDAENESLLDSADTVFGIIKDLEGQLESSYQIRDALAKDLTATRDEITRLRQHGDEQTKRVRYLTEKNTQIETLREELQFAEQEISKAEAKIEETQSSLKEKESLIEQLTKENGRLTVALQALKGKNAQLEYDVIRMEEFGTQLKSLQDEHSALQKQYKQSQQLANNLDSELAVAKRSIAVLEREVQSHQKALAKLRQTCEQEQKRNEEIEAANHELRAQNMLLEAETTDLRPEAERLEQELAAATAEKEQLKAELAKTRKTMQDIYTALASSKAKSRGLVPG